MKFTFMTAIGIALLLATPCLAQQPQGQPGGQLTANRKLPSPPAQAPTQDATQEKQPPSPEQAAVALVQQQRNQAQNQVSDLQAGLTFLQAQMALEQKYWAEYVKGLYEVKTGEVKDEKKE